MMYINLPDKRKKETTYAGRVKLLFYSLRIGNKKKIPFLRKKEKICQNESSGYPGGGLFFQRSISSRLELKKRRLKRKLSYFLSMML